MLNYKKFSLISLIALLCIGVVFSVLFYVGGSEGTLEVAGDYLDIPRFSDLFLIWNYVLVSLVCLVTICVVIWEFFKTYQVDKKKAMSQLAIVVGFFALWGICWFLGSPAEMKIIGYEGSDNVGSMAQLSDACLYLTYILVAATLISMVWGIIYTKTRK